MTNVGVTLIIVVFWALAFDVTGIKEVGASYLPPERVVLG